MKKLILSLMATLTILSGCSHKQVHNKENQNKSEVVQKTIEPKQENNHFVEILNKNTKSNIKSGATDRGAIMTTTLDSSNRPAGAHIRLMDKHEPGSNSVKNCWNSFTVQNCILVFSIGNFFSSFTGFVE